MAPKANAHFTKGKGKNQFKVPLTEFVKVCQNNINRRDALTKLTFALMKVKSKGKGNALEIAINVGGSSRQDVIDITSNWIRRANTALNREVADYPRYANAASKRAGVRKPYFLYVGDALMEFFTTEDYGKSHFVYKHKDGKKIRKDKTYAVQTKKNLKENTETERTIEAYEFSKVSGSIISKLPLLTKEHLATDSTVRDLIYTALESGKLRGKALRKNGLEVRGPIIMDAAMINAFEKDSIFTKEIVDSSVKRTKTGKAKLAIVKKNVQNDPDKPVSMKNAINNFLKEASRLRVNAGLPKGDAALNPQNIKAQDVLTITSFDVVSKTFGISIANDPEYKGLRNISKALKALDGDVDKQTRVLAEANLVRDNYTILKTEHAQARDQNEINNRSDSGHRRNIVKKIA